MKQKSLKLNAVLNVLKQCTSIFFPLITYPYVSRVLGADNLGRYSFSDSIVQIAITLSLIGIPTYAIREGAMIRNDKRKVEEFCSEVFTINFIASLLSYLILFILVIFVDRIRIETLLIGILSVNVMSKCLGRDWINSIYEEFLFISIRYVAVRVISLVAILLFVKTRSDLVTYVAIMAFAEFAGNILNIYYTRKQVPYRLKFSKELLRHMKPILILFCSSIASTIYIRSDITILGFLRPDSEVGVYTMSSKVYTIVKNVLNAIIMVAIPRLSYYLGRELEDSRSAYNKLLNNLCNALILLLLPASAGLFCLSGNVMRILGGPEYQWGGDSLKVLCVALMFAVFGCFFAHAVLIVNRRENIFFKATVISALVNIVLNFVFIPLWGILGAAITTLLSEICIVIICGLPAREYFALDKKMVLKSGLSSVIECILIFVIGTVLSGLGWGAVKHTVVTNIISLIAYAVILIVTRNEMALGMLMKIKKRLVK